MFENISSASQLSKGKALSLSLLEQAVGPVAWELSLFEKSLWDLIPAQKGEALVILEHLKKAVGKRIRPALYFMASKLVGYDGPHLQEIACVTEYIHSASLLHDDVVDSSRLRRGKPTVNSLWGDQAAVLMGDLIYSRASEIMGRTGKLEIVTSFARAIRKMSQGELFQLENVANLAMTESLYLEILGAKTGSLMGASCKAPAILAGCSEEQKEALETFGFNLGVAFQLLDDALDYRGKDKLLGKKRLTDLKEGRVTLPLLRLRDKLQSKDCRRLQALLGQSLPSPLEEKWLADILEATCAFKETMDKARSYTDKALEALGSQFEASTERQSLENLALGLQERMH